MTKARRDAALGLGAMALAGIYWTLAADIPESLLSDAVGAAAFPHMIAIALAAAGALLVLRNSSGGTSASDREVNWLAHAQAAGVVALLVAYLIATPFIGYCAAISVLIGAVGLYGGARGWLTVIATSAGGGILMWVMFAKVLGVAMPSANWLSGG
jgi:putative tricarboxylic transport membrane protein